MKEITTDLKSHLSGEVTTLATCWKLTRTDNVVMGFTDHDCAISIGGVTYEATSGFTPTAVASSSNLQVDNLDIQGMLDSSSISDADLLAGLYDSAEIEIFQINYTDNDSGAVSLRRGWLGEVSIQNGLFTAEVRGMTQKLSQQIGELYSPACRAELGDERCQVNMANYKETGSVTSVTSRSVFADSARGEAQGYFSSGKLTFVTGNNSGISMEIKEFGNGGFITVLPLPFQVQEGDEYEVLAGCDKIFGTCKARFDNAVNFRGEPHVPGTDRMLETSATRSEWE